MEIFIQFLFSVIIAAAGGGIAVAFALAAFWPVAVIVFLACFLGILVIDEI